MIDGLYRTQKEQVPPDENTINEALLLELEETFPKLCSRQVNKSKGQ